MNSSSHHFTAEVQPFKKGQLIRLKGELDAHSAVMASNVLESTLASGTDYLLIDCSQLVYISSAGVGVIISAYHLCLMKQTCLTLFSMQPKIKNVFEVLGMDKVLNMALTREEAIKMADSLQHANSFQKKKSYN
ncbi:STAS domain-containing protein [Pontibacter sp. E15-1]|uniref:STAS domain-containing protein n=1 Tax=Pontibacter sp. E15-1 TaxID=2919918 RepID=UPI001F50229C|nr:STAS domain-containing protein [Pontibacter sp. E15-1]MCJ8164264.1 STAS domain-containing protein [Pontibacter sp. E15-1]